VRVPFVMAGPGVPQTRISSFALVTDVAPTLLSLVGVTPDGTDLRPMTGRSLVPVMAGDVAATYGPNDPVGIEVSGNTGFYLEGHKITRNMPPQGDGEWRLYDINADPGETTDLSAEKPDLKQRMLAAYDTYAQSMGILPMPGGYDAKAQIDKNTTMRLLKRDGWKLAVFGLLLIGIVFGVVWGIRMRRARA